MKVSLGSYVFNVFFWLAHISQQYSLESSHQNVTFMFVVVFIQSFGSRLKSHRSFLVSMVPEMWGSESLRTSWMRAKSWIYGCDGYGTTWLWRLSKRSNSWSRCGRRRHSTRPWWRNSTSIANESRQPHRQLQLILDALEALQTKCASSCDDLTPWRRLGWSLYSAMSLGPISEHRNHLVQLLNADLPGDLEDNTFLWERMLKTYEEQTEKVLAEDLRIGIWLTNAPETHAHAQGAGTLGRLPPWNDELHGGTQSLCWLHSNANGHRSLLAWQGLEGQRQRQGGKNGKGVASRDKCGESGHTADQCLADHVCSKCGEERTSRRQALVQRSFFYLNWNFIKWTYQLLLGKTDVIEKLCKDKGKR